MYELPSSPDERPGCGDVVAITRALFGAILPPLMVMLGVVLAVALTVMAFSVTPWLSLIPIALVAGGIFMFARWERARPGGGDHNDF